VACWWHILVLKHIAKDINDQCQIGFAAPRGSSVTYATGCLVPRCQEFASHYV